MRFPLLLFPQQFLPFTRSPSATASSFYTPLPANSLLVLLFSRLLAPLNNPFQDQHSLLFPLLLLVLFGLLYRFISKPSFLCMAHPPCCLLIADQFFNPESGASMFLQKIGEFLLHFLHLVCVVIRLVNY
jgi:hypothetical protein